MKETKYKVLYWGAHRGSANTLKDARKIAESLIRYKRHSWRQAPRTATIVKVVGKVKI